MNNPSTLRKALGEVIALPELPDANGFRYDREGQVSLFDSPTTKARAGYTRNPLYTADQMREYALLAMADSGWRPISEADQDTGLVIVYTPDLGDGERYDFDYKEDGVWYYHSEHFEHYMAIGGANACGPDAVCIGPSEKPPYTHFMPLAKPEGV